MSRRGRPFDLAKQEEENEMQEHTTEEHQRAAEFQRAGKIAEADLPQDIERAMLELGAEAAKVQLYRREGPRNTFAFIDTLEADDFRLPHVKAVYGGGEYLARFCRADGTIITAEPFTVAGPPKDPEAERREAELRERFAPQPDPNTMALTKMMELYIEDMRARANAAGAANPIEMAVTMAKMISDSTASSLNFVLEKLGKRDDGMTPGDVLELIQMGMDFARESGGGDGAVVGQLAREVMATLQAKRKQEAAGGGRDVSAAPAPPQPAPAASPAQPNPQTAPTAGGSPMLQAIQQWVPTLIQRAQQGSDAALYAEVLADSIGAVANGELYARASTDPDGLLELMCGVYPAARPHVEWFRELLREFVAVIDGAMEDAAGEMQGEDVRGDDNVASQHLDGGARPVGRDVGEPGAAG